MKFKNKILPNVLFSIVVLVLVSSMLVSTIFAKYVKSASLDPVSGRVAAFDFDVQFEDKRNLDANFAVDGEPGDPLGHSEFGKYYYFKVQTCKSEVALNVKFKIEFNGKVAQRIRQGRTDKYVDGVYFDYALEMWDPTANNNEGAYVSVVRPWLSAAQGGFADGYSVTEDTINAALTSDTTPLTATITKRSSPNLNLDGTSGDTTFTQFRLKMIVYNNTPMTDDGNTEDYFFSTNCVSLNISAENVPLS